MQISELIRLLSPALFASALVQLHEEAGAVSKLVKDSWTSVVNEYSQATMRNSSLEYEVSHWLLGATD